MINKTRIVFFFLILIFLISFGILFFYFHIDDTLNGTLFFDAVMTVTAVFGVFGLIFQNARAKNLDEAQFIVSLNQEFANNSNFQHLLSVLESDNQLTQEEIDIASQYLDFFEPFYLLINKKVISVDMIDELFCFRFFSVVNNKKIQMRVLSPHHDYYGNICRLHYLWSKRLKTKRRLIPFSNTDLSRLKWYKHYCKVNVQK